MRPANILAAAVARLIIALARIVTAARANWAGTEPVSRQRVYFANHASNADFVLIWAVLPPRLRAMTRPVAASDYWLRSRLRSFVGQRVFRAVLIDRNRDSRTEDPVAQMVEALDDGASLILFPEGTRNTDRALLPFKAGLYHLASARPDVDLVPVWLENLNSVMPKGEIVPVPLLCTVTFGETLHLKPDETKDQFLTRARQALCDLSGQEDAP